MSLDGGPSNNPLGAWTKGFCNLLDRMVTRFRCANKDCDPLSGRAQVREMLREDHLESRLQVVRDGVKESLEGVDIPRERHLRQIQAGAETPARCNVCGKVTGQCSPPPSKGDTSFGACHDREFVRHESTNRPAVSGVDRGTGEDAIKVDCASVVSGWQAGFSLQFTDDLTCPESMCVHLPCWRGG